MQIDKLHTFVNEWNFDKMVFMVDLNIDIRTKVMLNITPCRKSCVIKFASSIVKFISNQKLKDTLLAA